MAESWHGYLVEAPAFRDINFMRIESRFLYLSFEKFKMFNVF